MILYFYTLILMRHVWCLLMLNSDSSMDDSSSDNVFWKLWTFDTGTPTDISTLLVDNSDDLDFSINLVFASILSIEKVENDIDNRNKTNR